MLINRFIPAIRNDEEYKAADKRSGVFTILGVISLLSLPLSGFLHSYTLFAIILALSTASFTAAGLEAKRCYTYEYIVKSKKKEDEDKVSNALKTFFEEKKA